MLVLGAGEGGESTEKEWKWFKALFSSVPHRRSDCELRTGCNALLQSENMNS